MRRTPEERHVRNGVCAVGSRCPIALLIAALLWTAGATDARSCSTFVLDDGDVRLVGHNLDETPGFHVPGMLCINKRGVTKQGVTWARLTRPPEGDESANVAVSGESGPTLMWTSVHGSVTINTDGLEFPDCGMNEAGLVVCEMSLPTTRFPTDSGKPTLFMSQWIQYLLDTCSSVDEVVNSASSVNLDGWNWHFLVADGDRGCAVIEFIEGRAVTYEGDGLPVSLLCNRPYDAELSLLGEYRRSPFHRFLGRVFSRIPRFVRGAYLLDEYNPAEGVSPHEYSWEILEDIRIAGWNKWSVMFDVSRMALQFNTQGERGIRRLSFSGIDFSCGHAHMLLDVHSTPPGDVSGAFVEYSRELNHGFLKERAELLFAERLSQLAASGLTAELYARRFADYAETTRCDGRG